MSRSPDLLHCTDCAACARTREQILWNCLPVVSYGDLRQAAVITIGLNPSDNLFYRRGTRIPKPLEQRFPMLADYGANSRKSLPANDAQSALQRQRNYFQHLPAHPWFRPLRQLLADWNPAWTYENGKAAHVDSAACATNQWQTLSARVRQGLLTTCRPHLLESLAEAQAGTRVLVNGRTAWRNLEPELTEAAAGRLERVGHALEWGFGYLPSSGHRLPVFAWNRMLQRTSRELISGLAVELDRWMS